jgi:hypothetical protein
MVREELCHPWSMWLYELQEYPKNRKTTFLTKIHLFNVNVRLVELLIVYSRDFQCIKNVKIEIEEKTIFDNNLLICNRLVIIT